MRKMSRRPDLPGSEIWSREKKNPALAGFILVFRWVGAEPYFDALVIEPRFCQISPRLVFGKDGVMIPAIM